MRDFPTTRAATTRAATIRRLTWLLLPMAVVGLFAGGGCSQPVPETVFETSQAQTEDRCAVLLENGLAMVRPEALGLTTQPDAAAAMLTQWLTRPDCLEAVPAVPVTPADRALLTRLVGEEGMRRATANRVTADDAEHVRDCLLAYPAAEAATRAAATDADRAVLLFAHVVRTISPSATAEPPLPRTPYEVRLTGRGTAADRAWVFADLLRQLRMDAVILRPAAVPGEPTGDDGNDAGPWWVGVPLDGGTYLFDPTFGMTVPAAAAPVLGPPALMPRPATWTEAVANPALLTDYQTAGGQSAGDQTAGGQLVEPIPADRLRNPRVALIAPAPARKIAMGRLELALAADRGVLLFDPLQDTPDGPGLYQRVLEAGRVSGSAGPLWTAKNLSVWTYPYRRLAARAAATPEQAERLRRMLLPYRGPIEVKTDGDTGAVTDADWTRRLWETRLVHLAGESGLAIRSYLLVRSTKDLPANLPPALPADQMRAINAAAADTAFYQVAQCQYDQAQYAAAAGTLQKYLTGGGQRSPDAIGLLVECAAAAGERAVAAQIARQLRDDAPAAPRLRWLAARWSAGGVGAGAAGGCPAPPPLLARPQAPATPPAAILPDAAMPDTAMPKASPVTEETPTNTVPLEAPRPVGKAAATPLDATIPEAASPIEAPRPSAEQLTP